MTGEAQRISGSYPIHKKLLRFQVISPVHIGTREGRLLPMEFLFNGGRVSVVDDEKLGKYLKRIGGAQLLDHFVAAAGSGDLRRRGIHGFLTDKAGVSQSKLGEVAAEISAYQIPGGSQDMGDFRPFVRDGFGRVYIPGTSLKGVLRTTILHGILAQNASRKAEMESRIRDKVDQLHIAGKRKETMKKSLSEAILQGDLLQCFNAGTAKQPQNKDLLRCLKVRDAYPLEGTCQAKVIKIDFLSKTKNGVFYWSKQKKHGVDADKPLSIWVEAITQGVFEVEISWDEQLFDRFRRDNADVPTWPVNGLDELMRVTSRFSKAMVEHEKVFFRGTGEEEARNTLQSCYGSLDGDLMRIGFGSGMLGTTVNLLWSDELRQKIRNECGHPRHDDPAPKSRRVWQDESSAWRPMGWVRLIRDDESLDNLVRQTRVQAKNSATTVEGRSSPTTLPKIPKIRVQPVEVEKPTLKAMLSRAESISVNDSLNLERLVNALDELEPADAQAVAAILKKRLTEAGRWKKHPLQAEIEMFL